MPAGTRSVTPVTASRTGSPPALSTSAGRSSSVGSGHGLHPAPASSRSTPRTWRSSSIVWRPVRSMFSSIAAASSGRVARLRRAADGLDHHHADRVGDDVVQLAGDPVAFLGDSLAGEEVALALGAIGAVGERLEVEAAPAQVVAEHEPGREEAEGGDRVDHGHVVVRHAGHGDEHDDAAGRDERAGSAGGPRCGRRASRSRRARPASSARRRPSTRTRSGRRGRRPAPHRVPPAEHHGNVAADDEEHGPPRRIRAGVSRSSSGDVAWSTSASTVSRPARMVSAANGCSRIQRTGRRACSTTPVMAGTLLTARGRRPPPGRPRSARDRDRARRSPPR